METQKNCVHARLEELSASFAEDPGTTARQIARIGHDHGYAAIRDVVVELEARCLAAGNMEGAWITTALRQPEWEWRKAGKTLYFVGIAEADGRFVARGSYVTGRFETGAIQKLETWGDTGSCVFSDKPCRDPRTFPPREVRTEILLRGGEYFLVQVGRVVDLIRAGVDRTTIQWTPQGKLKRFAAMAVKAGPFGSKEEVVAGS